MPSLDMMKTSRGVESCRVSIGGGYRWVIVLLRRRRFRGVMSSLGRVGVIWSVEARALRMSLHTYPLPCPTMYTARTFGTQPGLSYFYFFSDAFLVCVHVDCVAADVAGLAEVAAACPPPNNLRAYY